MKTTESLCDALSSVGLLILYDPPVHLCGRLKAEERCVPGIASSMAFSLLFLWSLEP